MHFRILSTYNKILRKLKSIVSFGMLEVEYNRILYFCQKLKRKNNNSYNESPKCQYLKKIGF